MTRDARTRGRAVPRSKSRARVRSSMIPGGPELLIIAFLAVLLFGANKIPELARSTGEAIGEFRKGREELEQEIEDAANDVEDAATIEEVE